MTKYPYSYVKNYHKDVYKDVEWAVQHFGYFFSTYKGFEDRWNYRTGSSEGGISTFTFYFMEVDDYTEFVLARG